MITSAQWPKLKYRCPNNFTSGKEIPSLLGFDSEALTSGRPFLFCMSDGKTYEECDTVNYIENIFYEYKGKHVAVYNLKYDSGAFLYHLPDANKKELWEKTETIFNSIRITYIPHKNLRLRFKNDILNFWDISQFFAMSLDAAAKRYLQKSKNDIETKHFTHKYIKKHRRKIINYCIQDAKLCADLGNYLLSKLKDFGIRSTSLYSSASLSFRYFSDRGKIVNCWNFYKYRPNFLKYAMDAYEGGKFEITSRGAFMGYEYDLCSAYPAEIRNLIDISLGEVFESRKYEKDAVYGFLRVKVYNHNGVF